MKRKTFVLWFTVVFTAIPFVTGAQTIKLKNLDSPRCAGFCFSVNNKLFVGGGNSKKDFWEYDPAINTWTQKGQIPGVKYQRTYCVGFAMNGKGYMGLGSDSASLLLHDFWEYDPAQEKWTQKANFPGVPTNGCISLVINNKAYIIGGTNNIDVYDDIYEYDPVNNSWKKLTAIYPVGPIVFGAGFSIENYGYITGGTEGNTEYKETFRFDPVTESWTQMADFPETARQAGVAFTIDKLAWVGTGTTGYTAVHKNFYRYNPVNNKWDSIGDIGLGKRLWGVAASLNGKAYIGTGWDLNSFYNDWWEFTPQNITGVNEVGNKNQVSVYNVINGVISLNLHFENNETSHIELFDLTGKRIWNVITSSENIELPYAEPGLYIVKVTNGTYCFYKKILVNHK